MQGLVILLAPVSKEKIIKDIFNVLGKNDKIYYKMVH